MPQGLSRKTLVLALLAVVVLAGAGLAWRYRMKQVKFGVEVYVPDATAARVLLFADGRQVAAAPVAFTGPSIRVPLAGRPRRSYGPEMFPALTARLEGPCRARDAEIKFNTKLDTPEMRRAMPSGGADVSVYVAMPADATTESATIWVDNREHPEVRLRVGGQERVVAASSNGSYAFSYDQSCPAGREVALDGQAIGALPESVTEIPLNVDYQPLDLKYSHNYLVDTSGKRCYTYSEGCYVRKGDWCIGPQTRSYSAKLFHRIPGENVDHFLERAPKEIQVMTSPETTMATRVSLTSGSCGDWW